MGRSVDGAAVADLSALGAASRGVWTRAQARRLLTGGEIDEFVRSGTWQVVWPGVYADGGYVLDAEQRAFAAVLASGGADQPLPAGPPDHRVGAPIRHLRAVAVGRTAARVWHLPLIDDEDPATGARDRFHDDVALWRQCDDLRYDGRRLHRHQPRWRPGDLVRTASGLWISSPLRTLADCRQLLHPDALVCAVDDALHRALVTIDDLTATGAEIKGHAGVPAFRRAVELADGRSESPGETLTRLVLQPVLPGLTPQVRLRDATGRQLARFDLGDDDVLLAVEFDSRRHHAGGQMVARDRRRDRISQGRGWWTERVTWFEVRRQQDALRRRVVAKDLELRSRARRPA